ncbi:DUF2065 domain-containing protein [Zoogloea sp.]|uniref:DUF2065 domain-containing protein n=1 Tax=Zoogloea sp. TaxID=49181 RepID=UPI00261AD6EC|nr:DUF2065 domain-containing protein [Zoogloea sp.]MDD3353762.1 DUF2065 domain-containing protein [Zoogloea sp.]
MGKTLILAFALMLVLEGLIPFASPSRWRETFARLISMTDGQIRFVGLSSMILGLAMLFVFS